MKLDLLGKIKRVEIREIFKDEARDFTPWLAKEENLALLSEEIGVEIKLLEVEASVGRFNVDILGEEDGTGHKIVIENQFNYTDHDHLGKLITYASGYDARIVVWIFEELRDEHRQAIEWLNENTLENLDFFAINIQLWQIDNSNPAPKFEVVVSPNEWTKTLRSRTSIDLSETKIQQLEFWTRLKDFCGNSYQGLRLQKPKPQHWYNVAIGSSEAHVALTVNTNKDVIGCELYIPNNKDLYFHLKDRSSEIEKSLGVNLDWIEANKACRIKTSKENSPISNSSANNEIFDWLAKMTILFQKTFSELVRDYNQSR